MRIDVHKEVEIQMKKTIEYYKTELQTIRAGRANPQLLDRIFVEYYSVLTPLNQMATISAPEARLLVIQPFDKTVIADIERAILKSDLGLNPSNDGKIIRLAIPMLTEENRRDLTKIVKKIQEQSKISIRNERRTGIDKLKQLEKDSQITEDELITYEKEVQVITDKYSDLIDKLTDEKVQEIMEV